MYTLCNIYLFYQKITKINWLSLNKCTRKPERELIECAWFNNNWNNTSYSNTHYTHIVHWSCCCSTVSTPSETKETPVGVNLCWCARVCVYVLDVCFIPLPVFTSTFHILSTLWCCCVLRCPTYYKVSYVNAVKPAALCNNAYRLYIPAQTFKNEGKWLFWIFQEQCP